MSLRRAMNQLLSSHVPLALRCLVKQCIPLWAHLLLVLNVIICCIPCSRDVVLRVMGLQLNMILGGGFCKCNCSSKSVCFMGSGMQCSACACEDDPSHAEG